MKNLKHAIKLPFKFKAIFAALTFIIILISYLIYKNIHDKEIETIHKNLSSTVKYKIDQISFWRTERRSEAVFFSNSSFFVELINDYLNNNNTRSYDKIIQFIKPFMTKRDYADFLLIDNDGNSISLFNKKKSKFDKEKEIKECIATKDIIVTDIHIH